jgi:Carbon starvation protein, predicted membrane protein
VEKTAVDRRGSLWHLGCRRTCTLAGRKISALWIVIAGFCALSISYRFYSKWLATKVLVLNEERATPAVLRNDNKDYVPTNRWMVFGHHFAAIAGPGPLVGPCWLRSLVFSLALSGS